MLKPNPKPMPVLQVKLEPRPPLALLLPVPAAPMAAAVLLPPPAVLSQILSPCCTCRPSSSCEVWMPLPGRAGLPARRSRLLALLLLSVCTSRSLSLLRSLLRRLLLPLPNCTRVAWKASQQAGNKFTEAELHGALAAVHFTKNLVQLVQLVNCTRICITDLAHCPTLCTLNPRFCAMCCSTVNPAFTSIRCSTLNPRVCTTCCSTLHPTTTSTCCLNPEPYSHKDMSFQP